MSSAATDPPATPRERLLDAAINLLADAGPEALQARRVAAEIGASSMAVYTHFGGMPQLLTAVVAEGFRRFGARLGDVEPSDDPMADLQLEGLGYRAFAQANPQMYRLMFGLTTVGPRGVAVRDMVEDRVPSDLSEGVAAFQVLVDAVERVMAAGRIREDEPLSVAAQLWSLIHGYVLLELAGFLGEHGAETVMVPLTRNLMVGLGDTVEAFDCSMANVLDRLSER